MNRRIIWLLPLVAFFVGRAIHPQATTHLALSPADSTEAASMGTAQAKRGEASISEGEKSSAAVFNKAPMFVRETLGLPGKLSRLAAFAEFLKTATSANLAALHAEWTAGTNASAKDNEHWQMLYRRWLELDPDGAAEAVFGKGHWMYGVLDMWAEKDGPAALAWLERHAADPLVMKDRRLQETMLLLALPKLGPREAVRRLLEFRGDEPDEIRGVGQYLSEAAGTIFKTWAQEDPAEAWAAALAIEGSEEIRLQASLATLSAVAKVDLARAQQMIDALPAGGERDRATSQVMSTLLAENSPGVRQFALSLPEGPGREMAISLWASEAAEKNPAGIESFLRGLPPKDTQDLAPFGDIIGRWLAKDPEVAGAYLKERLPTDFQAAEDQQRRYQYMFRYWSDKDPRAAAEYIMELPKSVREVAFRNVVAKTLEGNRAEALKWAEAKPESPAREEMYAHVADILAEIDPGEATAWLNSLAPGASKAAGVESFAGKIVSTNPDEALTWLHALPDENDRIARLRRVWQSWGDREAAEKWRDTSPSLTTAERVALGAR